MERGWIDWTSRAFIVSKKEKGDSTWVVEYRGLDEETEHDSYSVPLIDSIIRKQKMKRILIVFHQKHGYHQRPLNEESRPCTGISTSLGPMQ